MTFRRVFEVILGMHLYLIGLPGSGKSTAAPLIASVLGWGHCDLDQLVEEKIQQTIGEFVTAQGIDAFRSVELVAFQEASSSESPLVIACGGGTTLNAQIVKSMHDLGQAVWLDPPVDVIAERLKDEYLNRPLLAQADWKGQGMEVLETLRKERYAAYSFARFRCSYWESIQSEILEWSLSFK